MPLSPTKLKHWELIHTRDVSPSKWFPIENRTYKLPSGRIVDDFTITTLADVSMIVPITKSGNIILVRQFKPGYGDVIIEFPAGRLEPGNTDTKELALHELEEETGIKTSEITPYGVLTGFTTKATEKIYCYLAKNVEFNSVQKFDDNEDIEVVELSPQELDELIGANKMKAGISIAAWVLAKQIFPEICKQYMNDYCSQCKLPVDGSWYFCPSCGNTLKERPPVLSVAKQITIYLVSFFLAPLGLYWAIRYIKYKDNKTRLVGIVSLMLTVIAIAISIFGVKYALDQYSRFLNSISPYGF